ncbi:S49 family peptidase [Pontibacter litorisediminis]|uniref:S49 family peptidase n=1 Tax=Pontibacter litorisediminis TaxID=1846260 RepID=UPI0023EB05B4|nr:S49 family peptidase [Pontibacter litorisediminis]
MIDPAAAEAYLPQILAILDRGTSLEASAKEEPKEKAATLPYALSAVAGSAAFTSYSSYNEAPEGSVAVIAVDGPMMTNDFCGAPGTRTLSQRIKAADAHENISAIVVRFNTPGGTVSGTEAFHNAIKNTSKPLVAHADMMCSAGMWAGCGADLIVVSGKTGSIGSIGTMATIMDYSGYYEKYGIKEHVVRASRSVDKNDAHAKATKGDYKALQKEQLDPLNEAFLESVQEHRGGKLDLKKEDVLTGKVYFGQSTITYGLADEMGDFDYAISRALELSSQRTETPNSNTHTMFGKNKFTAKAIQALAGKKAEEITFEMLTAANDELEENGVTGAALITEAQFDVYEAAVASEKDLKAQVQTLTTANATLTQERDSFKAQAEKFGEQPGATPTSVKKDGTDHQEETEPDANQKAIDELPHNKALENNPLFN